MARTRSTHIVIFALALLNDYASRAWGDDPIGRALLNGALVDASVAATAFRQLLPSPAEGIRFVFYSRQYKYHFRTYTMKLYDAQRASALFPRIVLAAARDLSANAAWQRKAAAPESYFILLKNVLNEKTEYKAKTWLKRARASATNEKDEHFKALAPISVIHFDAEVANVRGGFAGNCAPKPPVTREISFHVFAIEQLELPLAGENLRQMLALKKILAARIREISGATVAWKSYRSPSAVKELEKACFTLWPADSNNYYNLETVHFYAQIELRKVLRDANASALVAVLADAIGARPVDAESVVDAHLTLAEAFDASKMRQQIGVCVFFSPPPSTEVASKNSR